MSLGSRIEERMKALGMSQSELARRAGIAATTVNSLIRGNSRTSPHLVRIAAVLRTSPAYLTETIDDPLALAPLLPLSPFDTEWLDLLHSLTPRDQRALLTLARALAGDRPDPSEPFPEVPSFQDDRLEFRAAK